MAAYAYHARYAGYLDEQVDDFFFEGLRAVGDGSRHGGVAARGHEGGRDQP
jgi:hydroxylamine reductase